MHRVNLDTASRGVKAFFRDLAIHGEGVELELDGQIIAKLVSPDTLSEEEREAILDTGWSLIERAQRRNKGVPAKVIEREIRQAVREYRKNRQ